MKKKLPAIALLLILPILFAGCRAPPPGAATGPIEPRNTRAEDTTNVSLPAPDSPEYCMAAQQILASTTLTGSNTIFTDMPAYRYSKSAADPHLIYQVVTWDGQRPIVVSCKTKTAAHLRAVYGPDAAGTQNFCPAVTRQAHAQAVAELQAAGLTEAAARAAAFVIDDTEPYTTGQAYLADFEAAYAGADGAIHLSSPGLYQDYDSWITRFLPWQVQGQAYCHLPTVDHIKALATGDMEPGTVITSADDAPVNPG